jgi:hypothetical protein
LIYSNTGGGPWLLQKLPFLWMREQLRDWIALLKAGFSLVEVKSLIKIYPINVKIKSSESGLAKDSVVKLNQIRTIDKSRLIKRLGKLSPSAMEAVDAAILLSLEIVI